MKEFEFGFFKLFDLEWISVVIFNVVGIFSKFNCMGIVVGMGELLLLVFYCGFCYVEDNLGEVVLFS